MSAIFFKELGLPNPDINLRVGSGTHAEQTAKILLRFEKVIPKLRPDIVIVYGDVNSTIAAALVCAKLSVPVAHVEAGLRSFDRSMPEEINRLLTDQITDILFTTSVDANENLLREGISPNKIYFVGNVMIDTLIKFLPLIRKMQSNKYPVHYALVTLHRPSNVDNNAALRNILESLIRISHKLPIIFPVHLRTRQRIGSLSRLKNSPSLYLIKPQKYTEFLYLEKNATVVITDSGGVQEETTFLMKPCLTLRSNTERPITVNIGTNILVGTDSKVLEQEIDAILAGKLKKGKIPTLWDGHAADRIADILMRYSK
jgi:UDP-N-acetylglucosamine 2-epimerase (non-hydrolysing)